MDSATAFIGKLFGMELELLMNNVCPYRSICLAFCVFFGCFFPSILARSLSLPLSFDISRIYLSFSYAHTLIRIQSHSITFIPFSMSHENAEMLNIDLIVARSASTHTHTPNKFVLALTNARTHSQVF